MCDYSLYSIDSRLAKENEELCLYKFKTGSLGFAATSDLCNLNAPKAKADNWWAAIRGWFPQPAPQPPAICVPPGARLLLTNVPTRVQERLCIGPEELVVFTEVSGSRDSYRDALLLPNGTRVLLQHLPAGILAVLWSLSSEPFVKPLPAEVYAA